MQVLQSAALCRSSDRALIVSPENHIAASLLLQMPRGLPPSRGKQNTSFYFKCWGGVGLTAVVIADPLLTGWCSGPDVLSMH